LNSNLWNLCNFAGGGGYGSELMETNQSKSEDLQIFYEKGSLFAYRILQESV
jgi:hypothetical protein